MKNFKKMFLNLAVFILLIILTFWLIFKDQEITQIGSILASVKIEYVILGTLVMFLYFLSDAFNVRRILNVFGEKISMSKSFKYSLIGFFFSAITPASTGGQPMEVYYMRKEKISTTYAITALLMQVCCYQIVTITFGIIAGIINFDLLQNGLVPLFIFGILINAVALTTMLICLFSKRTTRWLINLLIKILKFFKYKKIDERIEKLEEGLEKYHAGSEFIKNNKSIFIKTLIVVVFQMLVYYSIPFFVCQAFGVNNYTLLEIIGVQALLYGTVSGIPLPGAVGVSEGVFLNIYSGIFGASILSSAMLLNRGMNFYLFVIIGCVLSIVNFIRFKNVPDEDEEELENNESFDDI